MIRVMREVLGTLLTGACIVFPTGCLGLMIVFAWVGAYR